MDISSEGETGGIPMSLKALLTASAAVLVFASTGIAVAQNFELDPNYGTVELTAGFTPDPFVASVDSGGPTNAASVGCTGFVTDAPDYRLNYTAGSFPLAIGATSSSDTTIVVNTPDGEWVCNDDYGPQGLDPLVVFSNPMSGQYDIWVGSFTEGDVQPAQLIITEVLE
jgi:hypothetical protein